MASFFKKATKVLKYGSALDPQAWNRMSYAEKQKKLKSQVGMGDAERRAQLAKQQEISDARRGYYYGMVAPLERQMSADAVSDLTMDRGAISDKAMQDVSDAFSRARGATQRMRERYGIKTRPEDERVLNIEEARAKVNASNAAVDETRQRGAQRASTLSRLGMGMPGQASAAMSGAGNARANQLDYQAMITSGQISDNISRDIAGSSAIASMFADGGEVRGEFEEPEATKWLREKLLGRREQIDGSINRDENRQLQELEDGKYADGGQVGLGMRRAIPLDSGDYVIPEDVPIESVIELVGEVDPEFAEQLMSEVTNG